MKTWPATRPAPAPLHIGPDGTLFRPQPGDEYILRGNCPNRCGPMAQTPGWQHCQVCGFRTNITPVAGAR